MTREQAIKKVVELFSKYNLTVQEVIDYCAQKLKAETKEIKKRLERLK